ncbi:MAG TPA: SRPBCC family protein [Polyangiales bacterium]|nr:SRPBCC family protein [Polyangiales bacterium]
MHQGPNALARGLGWFSIGLGLTELVMPRQLGRAIGVGDEHETLLPLLGLREIAAGVGVLLADDPSLGMQARVAGDMLDLALLGSALAAPGKERGRIAAATAAVAGVTALDVLCARQLGARDQRGAAKLPHLRTSLGINKPVEQLYNYWRQLENLPKIMRHLESVRDLGNGRSQWVAVGPRNMRLEWTAEITEQRPNQRIAWRSLSDSDVPTRGYVDFKAQPVDRGSIVTVELEYLPQGPAAGLISKLFGKALEQQLENDLRRWKQLMETGEIATTEGQSSGKRSVISRHLP